MTVSNRTRWLATASWLIGGLAGLATQTAARAESAPAVTATNATTIGEVVVTAQKRAQNIQDVSLAITAVGGDAVKAIGHQDVTALVNHVPSLQVQQFSPTTVAFNIRGVSQNDFADSQEAPIAFYNDEVYVSAMSAISGQNYDLERIEVLRGPQGTLFGRNATGGLVQYVTAKPTRSLQGYATATFGSYGEIGTEGAISGPLTDRIRGRLSFSTDKYDGYIKNRIGPDVGSRRFYAARLQLESDVGDSGLLRVKVQAMRNDHETSAPYTWLGASANGEGLGVANAGPDFWGFTEPDKDPFTASFDTVPRFSRTYWSATARYEQDLGGGVQLTSISDYQSIKKFYGEDSDVSPIEAFNYFQRQHLWQGSQELRLSGKTDRLTWVGGVYGLVVVSNAHANIVAPIYSLDLVAGGPQRTTSYAVFGQGEYKLTDTLSFVLGARYSYDRKKDDYHHVINGVTDDVFNPQVNGLAIQRYKNWSGKAGIEYRPEPGMLFYVSANRGTKSGGFDIPNFPATDASGNYVNSTIPYKQEVLTNYEGGFKVSALDRRLDLNGSVFHYDYHNYQAFIFVGLTAVIRNLPAVVNGAELEINAHPVDGLTTGMFVTYLDTKVKNVTLPTGGLTDRLMPQASKWSVGWNASYRHDLGPGAFTLSTDWRYDSSNYFSTFNAPIDLEPGHTLGNVQASYTMNSWTASLFVNNVTNKHYRVYDLDNSAIFGSAQATFARPRWIGGGITYKY